MEKETIKGRGFLGQHGQKEGQRKEEQQGMQGKDDREDITLNVKFREVFVYAMQQKREE